MTGGVPVDPMSAAFFEAKYRDRADPWGFATDQGERRRYADILDHVGPGPFRRAFEPGCSIGELTRLLAPRCESLVAMDHAPTAVGAARRRCADLPHVDVRLGRLPADIPDGRFELVAFCEIGYYFEPAALGELLEVLTARIDPGGRLVGCHWTGHSPDHVLSGDAVHAAIDRCPRLSRLRHARRPGYVVGAWRAGAAPDR